jgi:adenylate cyclase
MKKKSEKAGVRMSGFLMVELLSLLSLQITLMAGKAIDAWEPALADMLFRWRYYLTVAAGNRVHPDVKVIGIDARSQDVLGRFGAGQWITRAPFISQIAFIEQNLKPSVLAYDIIIEDSLGQAARNLSRISESPERINRIVDKLTRVVEDPGESIPMQVLGDMNKLAVEQGNGWIAHRFATLNARGGFRPVLGFYFRGGWPDAQVGKAVVAPWTDADVFGADPSGDENKGKRIPYLKDIAIPAGDVCFPDENLRMAYGYAPNAKLPTQELLDYSNLGFINCPRDPDGIVRWIPLVMGFKYTNTIKKETRTAFVPSFALLSCLIHLGVEFPLKEKSVQVSFGKEIVINASAKGVFRIPIDERGRMYVNFDTTFNDFQPVNFLDTVLSSGGADGGRRETKEKRLQAAINGKIVITGVTSAGTDDGPFPLSSNTPLVHVHLSAINNILQKNFIRPIGLAGRRFLLAALFALFTIVCVLEKTSRLGVTAVLCVALYVVCVFACVYKSVTILPVLSPVLYLGLCSFSVLTYRFVTEERAKRRIRGMFSTMVSDKVLAYLESNPESFSLQGQNAEVSVMFSDVAGFSGMSEVLAPDKVTALLNAYFTPVTNCIVEYGGYLDKYIGDGIMAVWGVPFNDSEHALKACLSALEQQRLVRELGPVLRRDFGVEFKVRMGVNSGIATAGNMGSDRKFQYTVTGDTVNFAARIEPVNKDFGTDIIIGARTRDAVFDRLVVRNLGRIVVFGKTEAVAIYELLGEKGKVNGDKLELIALYEAALEKFQNRQWRDCLSILEKAQKTAPDAASENLAWQAMQFVKEPPPESWNGSYVRAAKN